MSTVPPTGPRLAGLDSLKGLAIILVVAIHAAPTDAPGYSDYLIRGVARLAVPLFLTSSGFLIGLRWPPRTTLALYFQKFLRLHALYGLFYWVLEPLWETTYQPVAFRSALLRFGAYSYAGQFYLFVLPQIYFVFAFLVPERLRSSTSLLLGSLALAAGTVAALAWSFELGAAAPIARLVHYFGEASVCLWLFPFSLGIWLGRRIGDRPPSRAGAMSSLLLAAVAATLAALDTPPTVGLAYADRFPYARWSILLGATALAGTIPWASRSLRLGPVAPLGRESFGIFVLNPLILGVFASQLGMPRTISESLLRVAATVAIAFVLARTLRQRIPIAFP